MKPAGKYDLIIINPQNKRQYQLTIVVVLGKNYRPVLRHIPMQAIELNEVQHQFL